MEDNKPVANSNGMFQLSNKYRKNTVVKCRHSLYNSHGCDNVHILMSVYVRERKKKRKKERKQ